jgi:hypothetical protein
MPLPADFSTVKREEQSIEVEEEEASQPAEAPPAAVAEVKDENSMLADLNAQLKGMLM